jgi:amino acid transporter
MSESSGPHLPKTLGFRDLLLLKVVAIINVSLLPPVAGFGHTSLILWTLAFLLFFVPEAVAVLTLARRHPGEGGIYSWTRREFGDLHGFVSGWCYWIGNLFYFPMQLVYLAGIVAYAGGGESARLVDEKWFVTAVAFAWLTIATGANILGLAVGKWIPNIGALGTAGTVAFVIAAGMFAGSAGSAAPVPLMAGSPADLVSGLSVMCFAFMGLELASTMGGEMRRPERDLPRAALLAGAITLAAYLGVTAALQRLVPVSDIGSIQGVIQAVEQGTAQLGTAWLIAPLALVMAVSIGGGLSAWYAGATRIPFMAGFDHTLPAWLGRVHPRWGSPVSALLLQGGVSAIFVLATLAGSTVTEAYQVLLRSSAIITMIPFCYMFAAVVRLPSLGGIARLAGLVGFGISAAGALTAFVPPADVERVALYELKLVAGVAGPLAIGVILFLRARRRHSTPGALIDAVADGESRPG